MMYVGEEMDLDGLSLQTISDFEIPRVKGHFVEVKHGSK